MAPIMWALAISTMPLAAASGSRPSGAATRSAMARRAASASSAISPPRKNAGSSRPSARFASVMVGRRAAAAVAGRPRAGAGAPRADAQRAARVDPRLAAAARADLDQVDHRRADRVAAAPALAERRHRLRAHLHLGGEPQPPVLDQPDLGGGAAHVEREHVGVAVRRGHRPGRDDARGGPGLDHVDGPLLGRGRRHDAAVGLHHVERRGGAERGEPRLERVHVARHDRHDRGVHRGGAGPQVLAELRADLGGDRQPGLRQLLRARSRPRRARGPGSGRSAGSRSPPPRPASARSRRTAARTAPSSSGSSTSPSASSRSPTSRLQRRGHQRRGLLQVHVVEPRADLAADLQDVAEAARHQHAHARGLALDDGVGRHRGGVDHRGHVAAARPRTPRGPARARP